jgi:hypothetical protein
VTPYSAELDTADLVQRGRDEPLSCPTRYAGAAVAPEGGTVTIRDASGNVVVDAGVVDVVDDVATYTLAGSATADVEPSSRWRIEWALEMPDGLTHTFDNRLVVCRRPLFPVVTERTMYARARTLDPASAAPLTRRTEFSVEITESWKQLVNRLVDSGIPIERITEASVLREVHVTLALALVFDDLGVRTNPGFKETAAQFRKEHEVAWAKLSPPIDSADDDGVADESRPPRGPVWVGSDRPSWGTRPVRS